jgi:hypothetical protein
VYPVNPSSLGTPAEPLLSLLYRYWFWDWLFADASHRDLIRRRAALRHNIAQRVHLPCYMRRWTMCALMLTTTGFGLECGLCSPVSIASAYTAAVIAFVVLVIAATGWLLLSARA